MIFSHISCKCSIQVDLNLLCSPIIPPHDIYFRSHDDDEDDGDHLHRPMRRNAFSYYYLRVRPTSLLPLPPTLPQTPTPTMHITLNNRSNGVTFHRKFDSAGLALSRPGLVRLLMNSSSIIGHPK